MSGPGPAQAAQRNYLESCTTVNPDHLADVLWNMHNAKGPAEATYPEDILDR